MSIRMLLFPAARLENVLGNITQIPKVKSVCRFHINQPMERADAVQILSVIRLQLHPWGKNKSQHDSTCLHTIPPLLHSRNGTPRHTQTDSYRCQEAEEVVPLPARLNLPTCGEHWRTKSTKSPTKFQRCKALQSIQLQRSVEFWWILWMFVGRIGSNSHVSPDGWL